ncbi:hypothetical protein SLS56_003591 [Neofusicoccum ribis]|uniref:Uncharacterized protein n=1 Tax=Neofusicoccum ribis TaxID=45134 RepID=A0ABR3SZN0_9PEZI
MLKDFFYDYDPPIIPLSTEYRNFAMPWDVEEFYTTPFVIVVGHFSILFPTHRGVFPLMKLPAELRLEIYEYSLSMPCKEWVMLINWSPREDKPVHHSTGETRMTTYVAPIAEVSSGLGNTKKRTSTTEPGHGEHNGEDAGGDEVQQNQSKKLKVAA